jgi:hypothetical protein
MSAFVFYYIFNTFHTQSCQTIHSKRLWQERLCSSNKPSDDFAHIQVLSVNTRNDPRDKPNRMSRCALRNLGG